MPPSPADELSDPVVEGKAGGPVAADSTGDAAIAPPPVLTTRRLLLRPFESEDAGAVQELASPIEIAANTRGIEHPYPPGAAEKWIATHAGAWRQGRAVHYAICSGDQGAEVAPTGSLLGAILLTIDHDDHRAELGYWIGKPFWNLGVASEAARALCQFGFEQLGLNRITAHHLARNAASGKVLRRIGMVREGLLRQHARKWGQFHDVVLYGLLPPELACNPAAATAIDPPSPGADN